MYHIYFKFAIPSLQVPQNILREVSHNVNKLMRELKNQQSPEALVYLKLLGSELGFIKTTEMEEMAYSAALLADNLLKMFPTDVCMYGIAQKICKNT